MGLSMIIIIFNELMYLQICTRNLKLIYYVQIIFIYSCICNVNFMW